MCIWFLIISLATVHDHLSHVIVVQIVERKSFNIVIHDAYVCPHVFFNKKKKRGRRNIKKKKWKKWWDQVRSWLVIKLLKQSFFILIVYAFSCISNAYLSSLPLPSKEKFYQFVNFFICIDACTVKITKNK